MDMFKSIRWYLQMRRKKHFQKDLAKCIERMLNDAMGLEDLDLVLSEEQIETMRLLRRELMELRKDLPPVKLGLMAALTEIEATSRVEAEKKRTLIDKEDGHEEV